MKLLEVLKIRIGFLQHLITLSGAATLIILAIMQRFISDPTAIYTLARILFSLFGLAAVVSGVGVLKIIHHMRQTAVGNLNGSEGGVTAVLAGLSFTAAVTTLVIIGWTYLDPASSPSPEETTGGYSGSTTLGE